MSSQIIILFSKYSINLKWIFSGPILLMAVWIYVNRTSNVKTSLLIVIIMSVFLCYDRYNQYDIWCLNISILFLSILQAIWTYHLSSHHNLSSLNSNFINTHILQASNKTISFLMNIAYLYMINYLYFTPVCFWQHLLMGCYFVLIFI